MSNPKVHAYIASLLGFALPPPSLFSANGKPRMSAAEQKRLAAATSEKILKAQERREKKKQFQLNQANYK